MGFVGQVLITLETPFIRCFFHLPFWFPIGGNLCKHAGGHSVHSVTTEACTSLTSGHSLRDHWSEHLTCKGSCGSSSCGGLEAHWSYLRYEFCGINAWRYFHPASTESMRGMLGDLIVWWADDWQWQRALSVLKYKVSNSNHRGIEKCMP